MRGLRFVSALLWLLAALPAAAAADEATDAFHAAVAAAYRPYREAVSYYESGNNELAEIALDEFVAAWKALESRYAEKPPPGYAKDARFAETLAAITAKAMSAVGAAPAEAAFALKPIRADLAALRKRNGQIVFSDCVDAMNAAMDRLWTYRRKPPAAEDVPAFKAAAARLGRIPSHARRRPRLAGPPRNGRRGRRCRARRQPAARAALVRPADLDAVRVSAAAGPRTPSPGTARDSEPVAAGVTPPAPTRLASGRRPYRRAWSLRCA
jgi:hypothetical protein